ncbi:MAG: hypothetical protein EOM50_04375 [Erysipelotrichia bacterium]|nr:hypothetical protein [Erysipelotrichia bacterium]
MKNKSWIKKNIEINFPLPKSIQNIIEILEELDEKQDYCYYDYLEELDCTAKEMVVRGKLTKKQWDTLLEKYER